MKNITDNLEFYQSCLKKKLAQKLAQKSTIIT